jgi:hypothetical protein
VSAARTVTVHTIDHGPVTIPEPSWCLGVHTAEGYREDIEHQGQPVRLTVDTPCHGKEQVLEAVLFQRPFSTHGPTGPLVAVDFTADLHEYDSRHLAGLADDLVAFAVGPLHQLTEQLQQLETEQ